MGRDDLSVGGRQMGEVEYKLTGTPPKHGHFGRATGIKWASAEAIDEAASSGNGAWIRRHDTLHSVLFFVTSHNADGQVQITVSGSPGPWPE